ncbi:MAG: hypothetical protein Q8R47_03015 [Nanoarchaeota archaeon]|nr:hypothetical protein [Nanoarchaeota archaeon]
MVKYKVTGLGALVAAGLAVGGSIGGFELAKDLTEYISLNSDYINTAIKATGSISGFGVGGIVGIILGSYLPGGERE